MATVLIVFVLSVAPAFGQNRGDDVQYNAICQNIIGSIGDITQIQDGEANAAAMQYSEAVAEVAQEQGVSIAQVNECLNAAATEETTGGTTDETTGGTTDETTGGTTDETTGGTTDETTGGTTDETTGGTTDETTGGTTKENTADTTTGDNTTADAEAEVIADTIPDQKVLANTGGPALVLLPALGLLLISSVAIRNLLRR